MSGPRLQPGDHVVVIGGGVVGLCSTLSLLARGFKVTVVERSEVFRAASYGNSGVVSPWSCVPMSMPGGWRSVPKWMLDENGPLLVPFHRLLQFMPWGLSFLRSGREDRVLKISAAMSVLVRGNIGIYREHLAGTSGKDLIRDSCFVFAYRDARQVNDDALEFRVRKKLGARIEAVDGAGLRRIEPALSEEFKGAVIVHGQGRALSPGDVRDALEKKALMLGALPHRASVQAIRPDGVGGWITQTTNGDLRSAAVLVCAGAWSTALLKPLGLSAPLEHELGYHIECADPGITLNNTVTDVDQKVVASSMLNGVRAGSFADFCGPDAPLDFGRTKLLMKLAKVMLPGLNLQRVTEWGGPRPSLPDSLPVIGAMPGHSNLFAAFGHGHFGFGMAPRTGLLIAQVIAGETPDGDLSPYSISRF